MKKRTGRIAAALLFSAGLFFTMNLQSEAKSFHDNTAYRIIDVNSGKPIDVMDGEFKNGTEIQIWDRKEGHKNQMFFFETDDDGYSIIKAAHSLKLIAVRKSSFDDFAQVWQWEDEGLTSMEWKVIDNEDGTVSFKNKNSGKMLDVSGGKKNKGTLLQQYRSDGTDSQKFRLEEVSEEEMREANNDSEEILKPKTDKVYRIVNAKSKKVLDIRDMSSDNGTQLQLWFKHKGNENQMFKFKNQGDGYYSIIARHSGKALEVGGSSLEAGATVNQWRHKEDYPTQMWKLIPLGDDKFIICNNNSGMVMDVYNGDLTNGQDITQYNYNGSDAQIFYMEEVKKKEYE